MKDREQNTAFNDDEALDRQIRAAFDDIRLSDEAQARILASLLAEEESTGPKHARIVSFEEAKAQPQIKRRRGGKVAGLAAGIAACVILAGSLGFMILSSDGRISTSSIETDVFLKGAGVTVNDAYEDDQAKGNAEADSANAEASADASLTGSKAVAQPSVSTTLSSGETLAIEIDPAGDPVVIADEDVAMLELVEDTVGTDEETGVEIQVLVYAFPETETGYVMQVGLEGLEDVYFAAVVVDPETEENSGEVEEKAQSEEEQPGTQADDEIPAVEERTNDSADSTASTTVTRPSAPSTPSKQAHGSAKAGSATN